MRRTAFLSTAMAALLVTASACSQAGTTPTGSGDPVHSVTNKAKNLAAVKSVDEAYRAMREIRAARFAIFDGSTEAAQTLVDAALSDIAKAKTAAAEAMPTNAKAAIAPDLAPFDVWMAVGEDYVLTPAKQQSIAKANEHLAKGDQQKAAETLRLANINILTNAAMVPTVSAAEHLTEASQLLKAGKYYDANLALKAIEDSVIIQSFDVDGVPQAKSAAKAMPSGGPAKAAPTPAH